ncbi:MAG TPA: S9 family peptidase [Thermomicrobiales bacterium]|nr:S9 family peptidase [Thermomicrobiales bacterium]
MTGKPEAAERWPYETRLHYPQIMEVAPSPDGERVVYAVREPMLTDERSEFITHLYLASPGGEARQLTYGDQADSGAAWSPDGRHVAFVSRRSGKANVWAMRLDGGEAWPLTRYEKSDVAALAWSPDGARLAFAMGDPPTEEEEKKGKARDDAKAWDRDFTFAHLHVVPFAVGPRQAPEARRITAGRFHVTGFEWLPGGDALALAHQPTPDADSWTASRVALVRLDRDAPAGADDLRDLGPLASFMPGLCPSPDGKWVAAVASEQPPRWAFASRATLYPVDGGEPRALAATPDGQTDLLGWSPDGRELYVHDQRGTASQLLAVPVAGGAPRELTDARLPKSLAAANRRGQIAFVAQDFHTPNAVALLDVPGGAPPATVATPALPADWPDTPLPRAETLTWRAPDGQTIEGILVYPLDETGGPYPTIVEVHGGPTGVYQRNYLGGIQGYADIVGLAARGYAVFRANPRGSSGYGREFRFANYGDWGGGDYRDIMAGLDDLVARGIADPDRLGILGWSYGGFMTSWVVTQTDRFKAACVGAGVTNPTSFNGTSDIPGFIPDYFGGEFWDDLDAYRRQTPILHAANVRTPTLIQHGENDIRVPLGQGREFYNALKRRGVPVEMVIYPRQGHGVAEPRLMLDVRRRATAWFERWLKE